MGTFWSLSLEAREDFPHWIKYKRMAEIKMLHFDFVMSHMCSIYQLLTWSFKWAVLTLTLVLLPPGGGLKSPGWHEGQGGKCSQWAAQIAPFLGWLTHGTRQSSLSLCLLFYSVLQTLLSTMQNRLYHEKTQSLLWTECLCLHLHFPSSYVEAFTSSVMVAKNGVFGR